MNFANKIPQTYFSHKQPNAENAENNINKIFIEQTNAKTEKNRKANEEPTHIKITDLPKNPISTTPLNNQKDKANKEQNRPIKIFINKNSKDNIKIANKVFLKEEFGSKKMHNNCKEMNVRVISRERSFQTKPGFKTLAEEFREVKVREKIYGENLK